MIMDDDVLRALAFAEKKHGTQVYTEVDGDKPYIYHLRGVVEIGERLNLSVNELVACAMHDIFEDTLTSYNEVADAFGMFLADKLLGLSRSKYESYDGYIERIAKSEFLRHVKVCDLLFNLEHTPTADKEHAGLHNRYEKALYYLTTH